MQKVGSSRAKCGRAGWAHRLWGGCSTLCNYPYTLCINKTRCAWRGQHVSHASHKEAQDFPHSHEGCEHPHAGSAAEGVLGAGLNKACTPAPVSHLFALCAQGLHLAQPPWGVLALLLLSPLWSCQVQPNTGVPVWACSSRCGQACPHYPSHSSPGLSPLLHMGLGASARPSQVTPTSRHIHRHCHAPASGSSDANTKSPPEGHGVAPSACAQAPRAAPKAQAAFPAHPKPPSQRAARAASCPLQRGCHGCSPLQAGLQGPAPPASWPGSPARRGRQGEPWLCTVLGPVRRVVLLPNTNKT
ncbi:uncharacterized protein LOC129737435 [Falco cherrug]|uniref:uncharacterized protein LOC129737435 n=1 Tax=Falco cherrug TaxID=345164 RepID=UPI00247887F3|nr:uncharacterized protein LOC129737435 [Falco cherrug]